MQKRKVVRAGVVLDLAMLANIMRRSEAVADLSMRDCLPDTDN